VLLCLVLEFGMLIWGYYRHHKLHHTAAAASRLDEKLFDVLTLLDALRIGAARERELASTMLLERLG
jgi:hypothetical protein